MEPEPEPESLVGAVGRSPYGAEAEAESELESESEPVRV